MHEINCTRCIGHCGAFGQVGAFEMARAFFCTCDHVVVVGGEPGWRSRIWARPLRHVVTCANIPAPLLPGLGGVYKKWTLCWGQGWWVEIGPRMGRLWQMGFRSSHSNHAPTRARPHMAAGMGGRGCGGEGPGVRNGDWVPAMAVVRFEVSACRPSRLVCSRGIIM